MTEPIVGWARPCAEEPWCGVLTIEPRGSVLTACRGRWAASSPRDQVEGRDRDRDDHGNLMRKCGGCDVVAKAQRTHHGLRELAAAEVLEVRGLGHGVTEIEFGRGLNVFDVSDLGGEQ